jgi:DNA repair protein RadC
MPITQWPSQERPRERLTQQGASALSDAELLAILIRHGGKGHSAVDIARQLLKSFNGLRGIVTADSAKFCNLPGLGVAKYCQIQAAAELGRRCLRENMHCRQTIHHSKDAEEFLIASLRDYQQEVFAALFLDNKHRVIQFEHLFYGSIHSASVYPREVVKRALFHNAAALIVAHNHPSGIAEPSQSDKDITLYLKKALALVDVNLLDHLVIGDNHAVSMGERGLLMAPTL